MSLSFPFYSIRSIKISICNMRSKLNFSPYRRDFSANSLEIFKYYSDKKYSIILLQTTFILYTF